MEGKVDGTAGLAAALAVVIKLCSVLYTKLLASAFAHAESSWLDQATVTKIMASLKSLVFKQHAVETGKFRNTAAVVFKCRHQELGCCATDRKYPKKPIFRFRH